MSKTTIFPLLFQKPAPQYRQLSFPNQNFCSQLVVTEHLLTYHYIIQIIITSRYNAILILYRNVQSEFSLSPPFVIGERIVPYKSSRRSIWRHILSPDFIQHKGCSKMSSKMWSSVVVVLVLTVLAYTQALPREVSENFGFLYVVYLMLRRVQCDYLQKL